MCERETGGHIEEVVLTTQLCAQRLNNDLERRSVSGDLSTNPEASSLFYVSCHTGVVNGGPGHGLGVCSEEHVFLLENGSSTTATCNV